MSSDSGTLAGVRVRELGHAVLYVRDLDRSAVFYGELLGWQRVEPDVEMPFPAAAFSGGRTHHELLLIEVGKQAQPIPRGRRVGLYHLGIKIGDSDDELREAAAALRQAGVTVTGASDHGVTHSLYVLDPDDNELELYIDVPGVDWRSDPAALFAPVKPLSL